MTHPRRASTIRKPSQALGPLMRLSHFFTYYRTLGGVQSILKRHHTSDAKRGHEPGFVFAFESDDFDEPDITGLGFGGGHSIHSMRAKFANHSRRFTNSVVVCHNMWGLQFLADLMPAKRRVGLLHSDWTGLRPHLETQRGLLDGVLCVSNALVDLVSGCLPDLAKANRVQLIPYPIDGLAAMPERPPLAKRTVVIGWVGRMQTEQKRVERLPALVKALESAGIDFRFELLGDGPRQPWLEQQLPSGRTIFHGRKSGDDYASVLRGWDFITSVSDYEGLPISMPGDRQRRRRVLGQARRRVCLGRLRLWPSGGQAQVHPGQAGIRAWPGASRGPRTHRVPQRSRVLPNVRRVCAAHRQRAARGGGAPDQAAVLLF